jgi:hypothetical protein
MKLRERVLNRSREIIVESHLIIRDIKYVYQTDFTFDVYLDLTSYVGILGIHNQS